MDNLPGDFSPPEGCLLIAEIEGNPVGCVALRSFEPGICEMKRLFVESECRSKGLGRTLAKKVIQEAKNKGYHKMLLDTGDFMVAGFSMGVTPESNPVGLFTYDGTAWHDAPN